LSGGIEGLALVERFNRGKRIIPTIVFGDGGILVEPSKAELATKLSLQTRARMSYYDVTIVGGWWRGRVTRAFCCGRAGRIELGTRCPSLCMPFVGKDVLLQLNSTALMPVSAGAGINLPSGSRKSTWT
jgi:hypothetical protein